MAYSYSALIGNVCPRKGQLDALPALEAVLDARSDVEVVFVGRCSGFIGLALKERAEASGRRLRVLGSCPASRISSTGSHWSSYRPVRRDSVAWPSSVFAPACRFWHDESKA